MEKPKTIGEIGDCIIQEMERQGYSPHTIKQFRYKVRELQSYVQEKTGEDYFSEELGLGYLQEVTGFPFQEPRALTRSETPYFLAVRRIENYQSYGALLCGIKKKHDVGWKMEDAEIIAIFIESMQTADNSDATRKLRLNHLKAFYKFLSSQGIRGIHGITAQMISDYVISLQVYSPVYNQHLLGTLRHYFRFLKKAGLAECDWSDAVPRVIVPANQNVPALWEKSEIELLLKSIDRGNATGKRNYAIILFVVSLGLRASDVAALKLENLKWERSELDLVQHKTKKRITQPIPADVGWALIDYIRFGRPTVDEPFVFLTSKAPYTQLTASAICSILSRQMRSCGIKKQAGTSQGMHSLRHALARRLLINGTPLSTIAEVMGHATYSSSAPYLKVDIEGLRECALSIGGEPNGE